MSVAQEFYAQALNLPASSREELAMLLLESLPGDDTTPLQVSDEWEQEIARRLADHEAGIARTVDVDAFRAAVRGAAQRPASP